VKAARIILAAAGIVLALFGAFRLVTETPVHSLLLLALWLAAAIVIHDGILSPAVISTGWLLRRLVPDRARAFLQGGLIVSGVITVIALPMIYARPLRRSRRPGQPATAGSRGLRPPGGGLTTPSDSWARPPFATVA